MINVLKLSLIVAIGFALGTTSISAQEVDNVTTAATEIDTVTEQVSVASETVEQTAEEAQPSLLPKKAFHPHEYQSMVFTHWEYVAIQEALQSRGAYRPPTEEELARDLKRNPNEEKVKPPPEEREIRLSGILYNSGADWTVWLNEERVTPDAIPKEVMDLKVYKSYIEFKWFDEYTNKIFPIRLRPHQRFNIDTRIFLPG